MGNTRWAGKTVARAREEVISAYGTVCWLCGQPIDLTASRMSPGGFSVDHVVPRSKGGTHDLANLRPAHRRCNTRRQDKPASQFRPDRPRTLATGWPGLN